MKDWIDLARSLVRPFIIVWGFIIYGICVINQVEVPLLLSGLVSAVIVEYFSERAVRRLKEK
jgi:hypothetical protein